VKKALPKWKIILLMFVVGVVSLHVGLKLSDIEDALETTYTELSVVTDKATQANNKPTLDNKVSKVVTEGKESVVFIRISLTEEYERKLKEAGREVPQENAIGTGWFVKVDDDYAYVVTNHHVVETAINYSEQTNLVINDLMTTWDYPARIVGYDEIADLAVLRVKRNDFNDWKALEWADHNEIREGDPVVAIGHGLSLPWSMSSGIITALDRWQIRRFQFMIQSDTVVNKGNSGGPLLNMDGKVVGVVDAILDPGTNSAAYAGVSLMIAGWQAEKSINEILQFGESTYAAIDFKMEDISQDDWLNVRENGFTSTVKISTIPDDSDALFAGIKEGDYIETVDGQQLTGTIDMIKIVLGKKPGEVVKMTVLRNEAGGMLRPIDVALPLMNLKEFLKNQEG